MPNSTWKEGEEEEEEHTKRRQNWRKRGRMRGWKERVPWSKFSYPLIVIGRHNSFKTTSCLGWQKSKQNSACSCGDDNESYLKGDWMDWEKNTGKIVRKREHEPLYLIMVTSDCKKEHKSHFYCASCLAPLAAGYGGVGRSDGSLERLPCLDFDR